MDFLKVNILFTFTLQNRCISERIFSFIGPSICFSENVLNFGGQYLDDQSNLKLAMHNHSDCPGQFQFDNDNDRSIFKVGFLRVKKDHQNYILLFQLQICPLQGIIEPRTYQVVDVTFQAHQPQVFYKRVNCLIHHQVIDIINKFIL